LLGIFSGLLLIYINLLSKANDGSLMGTSTLYWIAIGSMLWSKRESLLLNSGLFGTTLGSAVLLLVLLKGAYMQGYDPFLRIMPVLTGLGLGLLASGIIGLKQYWKELVILAFLVPPPSALAMLIDISPITAKFSTTLLWYSGFNVVREGNFIFIPNGGIEVYSGCSGIDMMLHLLGLSVLFLAIFPTSKTQRVILPLFALLLAFVVNSIRVGIMAILSEPTNKVAFEYWHKGDGSLLFSILAVTLLAAFCFFNSNSEHYRDDPAELVEQD
jgi:cyanoexosortase A